MSIAWSCLITVCIVLAQYGSQPDFNSLSHIHICFSVTSAYMLPKCTHVGGRGRDGGSLLCQSTWGVVVLFPAHICFYYTMQPTLYVCKCVVLGNQPRQEIWICPAKGICFQIIWTNLQICLTFVNDIMYILIGQSLHHPFDNL